MASSEETKPTKSKSASQKAPKLKVDTSAQTQETSPTPKSFDISSPVYTPPVLEPLISTPVVTEIAIQPVPEAKSFFSTNSKNLTEQEKELLTDEAPIVKNKVQKLMPESVIQRVERKKGKSQEVILSIIILLAVGFGGYQAYLWNKTKQTTTTEVQSSTNVPATINKTPEIITPIASTTAVTTATATSTPSSTNTSNITPSVNKLKIKNTPTGYLNVRNQPSTSAKLVTQIHPGEIYPYTDKKTGWFKISLTDGSSGWISSEYASVQ